MIQVKRTLMIVNDNVENETVDEIDLDITVDDVKKLGIEWKVGDYDPEYYDPYELTEEQVLIVRDKFSTKHFEYEPEKYLYVLACWQA